MKPRIVSHSPPVALIILALALPAAAHARLTLSETANPLRSVEGHSSYVRLAHQVPGGTAGVRYHANCLNASYGNPSARKSGYHVHGGGSSKYGVPCSPHLKGPQTQTLSPGSLTNPQLKKQ